MVYNFFEKKSGEELHKPVIRKFEKQKVYSFFKDNIWGANLADIQLMMKEFVFIMHYWYS